MTLYTEEDEQKLTKGIKNLFKAHGKEWVVLYFNLMNEVFDEFEITGESPKLVTSTAEGRLPITIGSRYIIYPVKNKSKIELIMPLGFEDILEDYPNVEVDEKYFFKNRVKEALWISFDDEIIKDENIARIWKSAIEAELTKHPQTVSGYKKSHNSAYYQALVDVDYRQKLFDAAQVKTK